MKQNVVTERPGFTDAIAALGASPELPAWAYVCHQSGNITTIYGYQLERRFGPMTLSQTVAIQEEIQHRLVYAYANTISL